MTTTEIDTVARVDAVTARILGEEPAPGEEPPSAVDPGPPPPPGPLLALAHSRVHDELHRAAGHVNLGAHLGAGARFRRVKRLVLRIASLFTREQHTYNVAVLEVLRGLESEVTLLRAELDRRMTCAHAAIATAELAAHEGTQELDRRETNLLTQVGLSNQATRDLETRLSGQLGGQQATVLQIGEKLSSLARQRENDRTGLRIVEARLEAMLRELRAQSEALSGAAESGPKLRRLSTIADSGITSAEMDLYMAFENIFRGTPLEVKAMLAPYLDEVTAAAGPGAPVLDVGFGRGDWLQLLAQRGVPAYGVDTNLGFVEAAKQNGFDARLDDAVDHLQTVPEASVGVVTAFHVVEHLSFEVLTGLLGGALRALKPSGLMILETPNPSNLRVGASNFYLDPTHRRPIPPPLLQFLVERAGFVDVEVRFLHPAHEAGFIVPKGDDAALLPVRQMAEELNVSLFGPQDYCVVARRSGG